MFRETYVLEQDMGSIFPEYFVITGNQGKNIRTALVEKMLSYPKETCFNIDFSKVSFIDFNGADELIAILQLRLKGKEIPNRYIALTNLKEQHLQNIDPALKLRDIAVIYKDYSNQSRILGSLNPYLMKTLDYVCRKKEVSARQMADDMNLPINTASTRLLNLLNEQMIMRREESNALTGGKQFIYYPL